MTNQLWYTNPIPLIWKKNETMEDVGDETYIIGTIDSCRCETMGWD